MTTSKKTNIYKDFLDRLHVGCYQTDNDEIITYANDAFARLYGYESVHDIIGKDIKECLAEPQRREEFKAAIRKAGGQLTGYFGRARNLANDTFIILVDGCLVKDEKGKEIGIAGIVRKAKPDQIELQKDIDSRDRFMQDISHELKTPMTTVLAAIENIRAGRTPEFDIPKSLRKIEIELQRLNLLTERLWRVEVIGRKPLTRSLSNVNILEVISVCKTLFTPLAERKKMTIEVDTSIKDWPSLLLDKEGFRHAISNLLDNAVKYSYSDSKVKIYGYRHLGEKELMVQNLGVRIPEEITNAKRFRRGYRAKEAQAFAPYGSGIGLSLVQDFADEHGVKIQVKSEALTRISGPHLNSFSLIFRS